MKRHSILTTLFPRLPISRYSVPELLARLEEGGASLAAQRAYNLKPGVGVLQVHEPRLDSGVYVADLLPVIEIRGKRIRCHLSYGEDAELVANTGQRAVVFTTLRLRDEEGKKVATHKIPDDTHEYLLGTELTEFAKFTSFHADNKRAMVMFQLWSALEDETVETVELQLNIVVDRQDCSGYDETGEKRIENAALRREHVARELTTGYRRLVTILLVLISAGAYSEHHHTGRFIPEILRNVHSHVVETEHERGRTALHSTREDAWRLLCTFHTIETAAKLLNRTLPPGSSEQYVLGLQDFVSSLTNINPAGEQHPTAISILDHLYREKAIKREIALRKTLEYYIFEALPCMPTNC